MAMAPRGTAADRTKLYQYKVDSLLGRGGTGTVYRGVDRDTGDVVALKLFHANYFKNRGHIRELAKSVKRFKKFDHTNVMSIYDFISGDEGECLVQEYIDGPDLTWYCHNRPWNVNERLMVCAQICNGLQYIHDQGFLHHDIKPSNVLFTRTGVVKLSDYSLYHPGLLSSLLDSGLKDMVTPMYIAPEVINKKKATVQSDIYALGITFYVMFAGRVPFEVDSLQRLYGCHLNTVPDHPCVVNRNCPGPVGDVIMRMIEKDPEVRYPDCDMLRVTFADLGETRI
jgi:serine/threonine-protein kinase